MKWNIVRIDMQYSIGKGKLCTFEAIFSENDDITELYDMINKNKVIPIIESFVGFYLYRFKDCYIQKIDNNNIKSYIKLEMICQDVEVLDSIKIKFKDKKYIISCRDYYDVKKQYGEPEEMTHEEFLDRLMVLRI